MNVPVWLWRLLQRPRLSSSLRLGPEDRLALEVADQCRIWTMEGSLGGIWWHTANEAGGANAQARMALARALGMIAGTPDLVFIGNQRQRLFEGAGLQFCHDVLLIELKAGRGTQSENQKDFETWASSSGVRYVVCRSLGDVERELIASGILKLRRAP